MKRAVPILIFILILILRQVPSALIENQRQGSCSYLYGLNLLTDAQGLGWIDIMEKGDPGELLPVFEAFQNEDQLFFSEVSMGHYRYLSHCVADLLLIDRPPPIWKPELINFA